MATEWFLRLDPIVGDSTDDRHPGEHVVRSWTWGVEAVTSGAGAAGSGAGAGRADFDALSVVVPPGRAAVEIVNACARGQRLPEAVLSGRRVGAGRGDFLTITLSDVTVTSTRLSAVDTGGEPSQAVTLTYGKVEVVTRVQDARGGVTEEVRTSWDVHGNREV
jgi:type VI secretion system secreted protein Hcp